jgi:ribosome biogenesis protein NSA1
MPRFLTGDELGNIKSLKYLPSSRADSKVTVTTLFNGSVKGKERAAQKLAVSTLGDGPVVRDQVNPCEAVLSLTDL